MQSVPVVIWYAVMLAIACTLAHIAAHGEHRDRAALWRLVYWLVVLIAINVREIAAKL